MLRLTKNLGFQGVPNDPFDQMPAGDTGEKVKGSPVDIEKIREEAISEVE
jgi:hypothetical protein